MAVFVISEFNAPVSQVWDAITNPNHMKQWYFEDMQDFKTEVGFKTTFVMQSDKRTFTATWEVTEVIPEQSITYVWTYAEYEGAGPVTFKLEAIEKGTKLTVINEGLESFPDDVDKFTDKSCEAGWQYFLNNRLASYL